MRTVQCVLSRSSEASRQAFLEIPKKSTGRSAQMSESCLRSGLVETSNAKYWYPDAITSQNLEPAVALGPALSRVRALLARSWSPDTAYPGTESRWFAGNPRGQCGVSSVWLAEVLAREYSIYSTFCRGSLIFDDEHVEDLFDHCWLEINGPGDALILDLTCDQARGFDRLMVFDAKTKLELDGVRYNSTERVNSSDLPSNPVWPRYTQLLFNIVAGIQVPYLGR
jgi:hypothetical protein